MIYILIKNVRRCKYLEESETIRVGDNRMTDIKVEMPSTFGTQEYPREDCSVEMRCYISEDEYLGYTLDTSNNVDSVPVTTDLTDKVRDITISFVITHSGNVIGTTNSLILSIAYARNNGQELVPREDIDRVINEQRQTIATQRLTIEEQTEQIAQDSETIGSLNNRVDELTSENEELSEQNDIYLDTIDELNKRVPPMETPLPVTPSGETQVIRPSKNYAGLASVTVDRVTAAADPDIQPENIKEGIEILGVEGSYNPFPEQSYGGIYITARDEDGSISELLIDGWDGNNNTFNLNYDLTLAKGSLKKLIFRNCKNIKNLSANNQISANNFTSFAKLEEIHFVGIRALDCASFYDCRVLKQVTFSSDVTVIGGTTSRAGLPFLARCPALKRIVLPQSITLLPFGAFGNSGIEEFTIPSSVKTIAKDVFRNYETHSLISIYIPNSVIEIGDRFLESNSYLKHVTIEPGFNCNNLNLSSSTLYSVETIVSWLEALADRTGETAYTLTMGATNLNKLTDEQKAIAIGKNWNLA